MDLGNISYLQVLMLSPEDKEAYLKLQLTTVQIKEKAAKEAASMIRSKEKASAASLAAEKDTAMTDAHRIALAIKEVKEDAGSVGPTKFSEQELKAKRKGNYKYLTSLGKIERLLSEGKIERLLSEDFSNYEAYLNDLLLDPSLFEALADLIISRCDTSGDLKDKKKSNLLLKKKDKFLEDLKICEKNSSLIKAILSAIEFDDVLNKKNFIDQIIRETVIESIEKKSLRFFENLFFIQDKLEHLKKELSDLMVKNQRREASRKKDATGKDATGKDATEKDASGKPLNLESLVKSMIAQVKSSNQGINSIVFSNNLKNLLNSTFSTSDVEDSIFHPILSALQACNESAKLYSYVMTYGETDGAKLVFAKKEINLSDLSGLPTKALLAQFTNGSVSYPDPDNGNEKVIKFFNFKVVADNKPVITPIIESFNFVPDTPSCSEKSSDSSCCEGSVEKNHGPGKYIVTVLFNGKIFTINIDSRSHFLKRSAIEQIAKCGVIHTRNSGKDDETIDVSISMQTDAHCVSQSPRSPWIGLVMIIDGVSIPFELIAADIGCGIGLIPICKDDGTILKKSDLSEKDFELLKGLFLLSCRNTVFRGKGQESGGFKPNIPKLMAFLQTYFDGDCNQIPFEEYIKKFVDMFVKLANGDLGIIDNILSKYANKINYPNISYISKTGKTTEFDDRHSSFIYYIFGHSSSLGKDGNHYAELVISKQDGNVYIATHSGSRGLGGDIFKLFSKVSSETSGGSTVLSDPFLVELYAEAHEMLRQFASYNRAIVTMNIISCMASSKLAFSKKLSTIASIMIAAMVNLPLFQDVSEKDVMQLITGKAHNTFSCYINNEKQTKGCFLSKGAITYAINLGLFFSTYSPGKDAGFVGFNISETNLAISCTYKEFLACPYKPVTSVECAVKMGVTFGPHGAGRTRSATDTARNISHGDVATYAKANSLWYNLGTSTPGDGSCINPELNAYNNVDTEKLKQNFDRYMTLETGATFKEGTDFSGINIAKFSGFILNFAKVNAIKILHILEKTKSFHMLSPEDEEVIKGLIQIDMPLARSLFTQNNTCLEDLVLYRILAVLYNKVVEAYWCPSLQVNSFKLNEECTSDDDDCEE